jgi:hypothetical protein
MALVRVKTANTGTAECAEAQFVLMAALGSDGKPYALEVNEGSGQLPVSLSGSVTIKETAYHNYAVQGATTVDWLQIIASTSATIAEWDVFDSSGQVMELGVGAVGAEVRFALLAPGGGAPFLHQLAAGSRVSIRAVTANADVGLLTIQAWG